MIKHFAHTGTWRWPAVAFVSTESLFSQEVCRRAGTGHRQRLHREMWRKVRGIAGVRVCASIMTEFAAVRVCSPVLCVRTFGIYSQLVDQTYCWIDGSLNSDLNESPWDDGGGQRVACIWDERKVNQKASFLLDSALFFFFWGRDPIRWLEWS